MPDPTITCAICQQAIDDHRDANLAWCDGQDEALAVHKHPCSRFGDHLPGYRGWNDGSNMTREEFLAQLRVESN